MAVHTYTHKLNYLFLKLHSSSYLQANYEQSNKLVLFKKKNNQLPKQLGNLLNELSLRITKYKIKVHSFVSIKSYN